MNHHLQKVEHFNRALERHKALLMGFPIEQKWN